MRLFALRPMGIFFTGVTPYVAETKIPVEAKLLKRILFKSRPSVTSSKKYKYKQIMYLWNIIY